MSLYGSHLQFFKYDHLPKHLQDVSFPFSQLAFQLSQRTDAHPRMTRIALDRLLEAKDAAVRAVVAGVPKA